MVNESVQTASQEYQRLRSRVPIGVIHSEAEYDRAVAVLDAIIDEIGEDENHALAELAEAISVFVEAYESEHYPMPEVKGVDMLRFLMDQHGLKQSDLPEIGSQSVVSEILSGKRGLNVRQIARLSERFGVPADVFIDKKQEAA